MRLRVSSIKCKLCPDTIQTNDMSKIYYHYKTRHPNQKASTKIYFPKALAKYCDRSIPYSTLYKRRRTAEKMGANSCVPKRCVHKIDGQLQCRKRQIVDGERFFCVNHPFKSIQYARLHNTYADETLGAEHKAHITEVCRKQSTITDAGYGLWTTDFGDFQEGDYITQYAGTLLTEQQYKNKEHNPQHTIYCRGFKKPYLSGLTEPKEGEGYGSFVNRGTASSVNCEYVFKSEDQTVWLRATKYIAKTTEMFTVYGGGFHVPRNNVAEEINSL